MKSVSILPKVLIGLLLSFSISSFGQAIQEKIQGTWKVYKYEAEKEVNNSAILSSKVVGTIFTFENCNLRISTKENGVTQKSGEYSLIGNKLTIGVDQPAAEILLLNDTELKIKLPYHQGIIYFSKS